MTSSDRIRAVVRLLAERTPQPECPLRHRDAWELLVAVILSAQCTDARVNLVTPVLFARFPAMKDFAAARPEDVEPLVFQTGFYRTKARRLIAAAGVVLREFGGQVPRTMEELVRVPGVARKTANVVLGDFFHVSEGIAVDTHVTRVAARLGLTRHRDVVRIERDLMKIFPRAEWPAASLRIIFLGREICFARKPGCSSCPLAAVCPRIGVTTAA